MTDLFERAQRVLPGGVNSPVRAMRQIGREPIFIERGEGCELVDVDGNRYLDWVGSWGPLILGHAEPSVVSAVIEAAKRGTSYGAATAAEVELAEEVVARVPSVGDGADDQLRDRGGDERRPPRPRASPAARSWSSSPAPTTATPTGCSPTPARAWRRSASRAAPGSPRRRRRRPSSSPGTTARRWRARSPSTRSPPSSPSRSPPTWASSRPPTASSSSSATPPARPAPCSIFDEVITGFRVARGGAQELYGVEPDLTVLGKVIGGGLPAAAYRRTARGDGADRPGRRRLPGRHPLREPAGGRRRAGDAGPARRRRLPAPRRPHRPPRRRLRRARRRAPAPGRRRPGPGHALLQRRRRCATSPPPAPATPRPTPASAAPCSTAASTRRRPSSRPGSSPSPTTRRAIDRTLEAAAESLARPCR